MVARESRCSGHNMRVCGCRRPERVGSVAAYKVPAYRVPCEQHLSAVQRALQQAAAVAGGAPLACAEAGKVAPSGHR
jgi:hypothetical protein